MNAVLDGESVAVDAEGRSSFEPLQQRMNLQNEREIKRVAKQIPVAFVAFDLLWLDGRDTTGLSLEERRELLQLVVWEDVTGSSSWATRRRTGRRSSTAHGRWDSRAWSPRRRLGVRPREAVARLAEDRADLRPRTA